ncbi:MAG TPA: glycosyltransferase family 1 protein [Candidatus Omnitrophota bacterium]|nr:glycosyltransferase family 1 protein [Candidatus Omnitrophota bacterium]
MTKVLLNAVHAKSGGGVTYLRNILPLLAARPELTIELVVQAEQAEMARALVPGLPVHVLPSLSNIRTVFVQEQLDIPRLARQIGADVVFSPANFGPLFGTNVILLRNAFEVGRLEERFSKRLYWFVVKWLSQVSFMACKRAICVSRHAADNFLKAFGRPGDPRVEIVPHGVSPLFTPGDEDARIPRRLLAVSDIYVQKNFETLLDAVALLAPDFPELRLDIAGRPLDGEYLGELKGRVERLGIGDRVSFLGGLPAAEVAELYRRAELFVFPSLVETFGNPLLEAMASGLPVVVSNAAAMPEVAGGAALLAAPGDAADMADKIRALLTDRALWRERAGAGIARAAQFTWARTAEATARVLVEAAGKWHPAAAQSTKENA